MSTASKARLKRRAEKRKAEEVRRTELAIERAQHELGEHEQVIAQKQRELDVLNSQLFADLLDRPGMQQELRGMTDALVRSLDEWGRTTYRRQQGGVGAVEIADAERLAIVRTSLHNTLDHMMGDKLEEIVRTSKEAHGIPPADFRRVALQSLVTFMARSPDPPAQDGGQGLRIREPQPLPEDEGDALARMGRMGDVMVRAEPDGTASLTRGAGVATGATYGEHAAAQQHVLEEVVRTGKESDWDPEAVGEHLPPTQRFHMLVSSAMGFTQQHRQAAVDWYRKQQLDDPLHGTERPPPSGMPRDVGWKAAFAGLADDFRDETLLRLGHAIWTAAGGARVDRAEAERRTAAWIDKLYRGSGANERKAASALRVAEFAGTWAVHAFQKIVTTHKFAAALICSDAAREAVEDLHVHWSAFMVCVPNGLLTVRDEHGNALIDFQRICVCVQSDGMASLLMYDHTGGTGVMGRMMSHIHSGGLAALLYEDPETVRGTTEELLPSYDGVIQRAMRCAKRLVVGLLLAMQNQHNVTKGKRDHGGETKRKGGEPDHRVCMVGNPVKVDCRPEVARYLTTGKGKGKGPLSVQFLVRGHIRNQPFGPKRSLRKVIMIEPFWKGPDGAPILTRPKQVTGGGT